MPTADKRIDRIVPIEFSNDENFEDVPCEGRLSFVLISKGSIRFEFNGVDTRLNAPALLFLSVNDKINVLEKKNFSAMSFSFAPTFINSTLTFEALLKADLTVIEDVHDRDALLVFLVRDSYYTGILELSRAVFMQMLHWFSCIGEEIDAQSDGAWTCRIRRWFLQALYLSGDMKRIGKKADPEDVAAEYMNVNYRDDITLETLCQVTDVNRTTLSNRFKKKYGVTMSEYLQDQRIKMACEILAHTNLSLSEIAEATGFKYDTYFIKRFTKVKGISPTDYRNDVRERAPGLSKRKRAVN